GRRVCLASGKTYVLLNVDHHPGSHPHLYSATPRGSHLCADGLHHYFGPDWLPAVLAYLGASAVRLFDAAKLAGEGDLHCSCRAPNLRRSPEDGSGAAEDRAGSCTRGACRDVATGAAPRLRVSP